MWKVFIFLTLWALHCTVSAVSSTPPSPISAIFSSVNLRNVLRWFPGNDTPGDALFSVQYAIYGDSVADSKGRRVHWRAVPRCTDIAQGWCDLSKETWDLEQSYYARVRAVSRTASSKWALTLRFDPKSDTTFGPPLLSVALENSSAIITLRGPMRYQPNNHTPLVSMAMLYPHMMYNLSIENTRRNKTSHVTMASSPYKYRLMEYDTEYCFSAKAKFLAMPIQCQSSERHCITTPADPVIGQMQRVIWSIVVLSLCMCVLVVTCYLLYHYLMGKGQKTPYILNSPSFSPTRLTFPPEKPNLILITVIKPSDPDSCIPECTCPREHRNITDPPRGYTTQRPEMPPEPEQPWGDASIDYGIVALAPKINNKKYDSGGNGNNLKGKVSVQSYKQKERRVENDPAAGGVTPQAKSCLSTHLRPQMHTPMCNFVQAQTCSPLNSASLTQTQGATSIEVKREEDGEFLVLLTNKVPQIGLHIPLNVQINNGRGLEEEMLMVDGKIDEGVEEGGVRESVPLLSAYAAQNIEDMSASHTDQSDCLSDGNGVLRQAAVEEIKKDDDEQVEEEQEEGTIFIDWDPKARKLVLQETAFTWEGGLEGVTGVEGEGEGATAKRGELLLENVFVRQASEEEAEARSTVEIDGKRRWEEDDILAKWNLVISMDE